MQPNSSFARFALPSAFAALAAMILLVACNRPGSSANQAPDNSRLITLGKDNFQTEVLASSQPVLVDFWAEWCGPCKVIAPAVAALATEFEGRAKVGKVDVDAQPELAREYGINAIPTLLIFKDGKKVDEIIGVQSQEALRERLKKFVTVAGTPVASKP